MKIYLLHDASITFIYVAMHFDKGSHDKCSTNVDSFPLISLDLCVVIIILSSIYTCCISTPWMHRRA